MTLLAIIGYLVAINLVTVLVFRTDKSRAMAGEWRISESNLLLLVFLGGWVGAKLAQRRYRHKSRKRPFCTMLACVPVVWLGGAVILFALAALPQLPQLVVSTF